MSERKGLDWDAARERLTRARLAIESGEHSPQRLEARRRKRAAILSRPTTVEADQSGEAIMVFRLGTELYALPVSQVAEVVARPSIAPVPGASGEIAGLIQVRGEIRVVWDLTRMLGMLGTAPAAGEFKTVLLVRNAAGSESGFMVEEVTDIRQVSKADRLPPPETVSHSVWSTADLVTVLDTDALLPEANGENSTA